MSDLIFITELHTDLSIKLFLIISSNNTTFLFLTLTLLGINFSIPLLLMKNFSKLFLNYLITRPVVLQALVMKCSNISAPNVPLLLRLFLIAAFLKTESPSNGNTVESTLSLNETLLIVILILPDLLVLSNIFASFTPKSSPIALALYFLFILFFHLSIMLPFPTTVPQFLSIYLIILLKMLLATIRIYGYFHKI